MDGNRVVVGEKSSEEAYLSQGDLFRLESLLAERLELLEQEEQARSFYRERAGETLRRLRMLMEALDETGS